MIKKPPLWNEGASPFPRQREALAFLKERLPNNEPYRAWTNVEFIADDGSVNEIDTLVVTPRGFFLIEIKSHPGIMFGDGQNWRWRRPNGSEKPLPHPLILANLKAKRLRSLLPRQAALRNERDPFITALIFMSSADLDCRLHDIARTSVCGSDPDPVPLGAQQPEARTAFAPLPGIVTIKDPSKASLRGTSINRPMSAKIAEAIEQAGLKPSNRGRRAGDWELGELLDEGPGWQDFIGSRPRMTRSGGSGCTWPVWQRRLRRRRASAGGQASSRSSKGFVTKACPASRSDSGRAGSGVAVRSSRR